MRTGMYVTHHGKPAQVHTLADATLAGTRGYPIPATRYGLNVGPGERTVTVFAANDPRHPLLIEPHPAPARLPACPSCHDPAFSIYRGAPGWPCAPGCGTGKAARAELADDVAVRGQDGELVP